MQRNSKPLPWRPRGASDTLESSETFNGAMTSLQNLIPAPAAKGLFLGRPAAIFLAKPADFVAAGFSNPTFISVSKVFGDFVYGLISTSRFTTPPSDEPFCYNLLTNAFVPITNVNANNVPATALTSGAWTPPQVAVIGARLVITHPGFSGTAQAAGTGTPPVGGFETSGYPGTTTSVKAWFGYFNLTDPAHPVWYAGDCIASASAGAGAFTGFSAPPAGVAQLSGRAYFLHNPTTGQPAAIFSDVNTPLVNGSAAVVPILTFGDNSKLTAIAGLPLSNQLGGVIQSLMVFKDGSNIFQITGDATTNNLAINSLNVPTGTLAPATVVPTPKGLGFISPDGFRIIDWDARVSDPIGIDGQGITTPFIYANVPSRMNASCNGEVYRVSVQNSLIPSTSVTKIATAIAASGTNQITFSDVATLVIDAPITGLTNPSAISTGTVITAITGTTVTLSSNLAAGVAVGDQFVCTINQGFQEWWYDFGRQIWTGPHTCAMSSLSPYQQTFVGVLQGVPAMLWKSDYLQSITSTFVENGNQLLVNFQTVLLPDTDTMTNNVTTQTTIDLAFSTGANTVQINAIDQNGVVLTTTSIGGMGSLPIWGQATWGAFVWGGTFSALAPRIIPWPIPITFTRVSFQATTTSNQGLRLGAWHIRYKVLRYLVDINSALPAVFPSVPPPTSPFILNKSQLGGGDVLG